MIEKKIKGYAAQFIIFSIFYLMMFGVGIGIIFYNKPIVAIVWFTLILTIVLTFMYYSSTRVIYKVEYNENNLIFYSCLKRYKTNRKVEFQEKTIGCFVMLNGRKLRLPFYTGIPSKHTQYWEKSEVELVKKWINDL